MGCDISFSKNKGTAGQKYTEAQEKRVLLLGLDNAGKTSILLQMKEQTFMPSAVPTIGLNIEQIEFEGLLMTFWDVGGQAVKLWKHYFDSIDGIMYVIDSTDKGRLLKSRDELHKISRDAALAQVPFLIMINKTDLADKRMSGEEIQSKLDLQVLKVDRTVHVQECSALESQGIWQGLQTLTKTMSEKATVAVKGTDHQVVLTGGTASVRGAASASTRTGASVATDSQKPKDAGTPNRQQLSQKKAPDGQAVKDFPNIDISEINPSQAVEEEGVQVENINLNKMPIQQRTT